MESCENEDSTSAANIPPNIVIVVMVGLPGSGKTTLSLSLPHILGEKFHVIHVCYDQMVPFNEQWSSEELQGLWKGKRSKVLLSTEVLLCYLVDAKNSIMKKKMISEELFPEIVSPSAHHVLHEDSHHENQEDLALLSGSNHREIYRDISKSFGSSCKPSPRRENAQTKCQNMAVGCYGHYTMFDSYNQTTVSIENEIKDCDIQNEVFVLCIDDNCYYRSMRKEWWNLAAKYNLPFCIIALDCKVNMCIERVRERFSSSQFGCIYVPPEVIVRMDERLEFPDGELFPWEKHSVIIESNSLGISVDKVPSVISPSVIKVNMDEISRKSINEIRELLCNAFLEPAKPFTKEVPSKCCPTTPSLVHKVDLALRRCVGKNELLLRPQINKKRKTILEDLRSGKLSIPSDVFNEDCGEQNLDSYVTKLIGLK